MWSRELAEDRTEHQKGDLKEAWLLVPEEQFEYFRNAQPSLFMENGPKNRTNPVNGSLD